MRSKLALTPELVSLVERKVPQDHLPEDPGRIRMTDADYANSVDEVLKEHDTRPIWVFGYGSLLWNPGFSFVERRTTTQCARESSARTSTIGCAWSRSHCPRCGIDPRM